MRTFFRSPASSSLHVMMIALSMLGVLCFTGCQTGSRPLGGGPTYQPSNVFRQNPSLPPDLRRVAVLPLGGDEAQVESVSANQALESVLRTELLKTHKFDFAWVTPESLRQWTGRKTWSADDKLPSTFFNVLREQTGCDGVLFARVSRFHPYPPLVVGWNLKLVAVGDAQTVWALDEVFDASDAAIAQSARQYERQQTPAPVTDSPLILNSPRRFGQYTAWAALGTLPQR